MVKRYYGGLIKATPATTPQIFTPSTVYLDTSGVIDTGAGTVVCDIAIIGGGGGASTCGGGGGEVQLQTSVNLVKGVTYTITIGGGGTALTPNWHGLIGNSTTMTGTGINFRALGGGGGASATTFPQSAGFNGGGANKGSTDGDDAWPGAVGGYLANRNVSQPTSGLFGGAGAGSGDATSGNFRDGGPGVLINWLGSDYYWGGGGGSGSAVTGVFGGNGGVGGGGGGRGNTTGQGGIGGAGYPNSGSNGGVGSGTGGPGGAGTGGGAGGRNTVSGATNGGSGAVLVRYTIQAGLTPVVTGSPILVSPVGSTAVYVFTGTGTIRFT